MVVGECRLDADGEIEYLQREWFRQGMIFKDEEAFETGKGVCYVPELTDTLYDRDAFLAMANGQKDIAKMIFDAVDWQHPETYLDEQYVNGELDVCKNCEKIFESYDAKKCPHCGAEYVKEEE